MSLSILKTIGDLEVTSPRMTLQLVHKSVRHFCGVVEDIFQKVDRSMFPIDFVVMNMG